MTLRELIEQAKQWQEENPNVDVMEFDLVSDSIDNYHTFEVASLERSVMEINLV